MPVSGESIHRRPESASASESESGRVVHFPSIDLSGGRMAEVTWRMKGQYIKNCNCIATCPCDTIGIPHPEKGCTGMAGMRIEEGNFGDVKLDKLSWVVTYSWPGALHEGNGAAQAFIDKAATDP